MAHSDHYSSVRRAYDAALFYSVGPYTNWQAATCLELAALRPDHRLADIGGGSGLFASMLRSSIDAVRGQGSLTVVEPSPEMLEGADQNPLVDEAICADAVGWAEQGGAPFDCVLLKEVVHHLSSDGRAAFCSTLLRSGRLVPGGRVLIVTRPHRCVDYPFWPEALEVWAAQQPATDELVDELRRSGFVEVQAVTHAYPCELPLERWCGLVAARFWSTFAGFSDVEIARGVEHIRASHAAAAGASRGGDDSMLRFEDRLVFITAVAPQVPTEEASSAPPRNAPPLPLHLRLARDGFASPLRVLGRDAAVDALAAFERFEASRGGQLCGDDRFKLHLLLPWVSALVRHPALLAAARAALGTSDLLVWSSDINDKAPHSAKYASPHQDSTYASLCPADAAVTAWLALTDAPSEAGCLVFARGSHLRGQLPHAPQPAAADNLLSFGQSVREYEDGSGAGTVAPLLAGEASLHFFRAVHWSPPNTTAGRRLGLAIRYVAASVVRSGSTRARESATLVSGAYESCGGAFDLEAEPTSEAGQAEWAQHEAAMAREKSNYFALGDLDSGGSTVVEYK